MGESLRPSRSPYIEHFSHSQFLRCAQDAVFGVETRRDCGLLCGQRHLSRRTFVVEQQPREHPHDREKDSISLDEYHLKAMVEAEPHAAMHRRLFPLCGETGNMSLIASTYLRRTPLWDWAVAGAVYDMHMRQFLKESVLAPS